MEDTFTENAIPVVFLREAANRGPNLQRHPHSFCRGLSKQCSGHVATYSRTLTVKALVRIDRSQITREETVG